MFLYGLRYLDLLLDLYFFLLGQGEREDAVFVAGLDSILVDRFGHRKSAAEVGFAESRNRQLDLESVVVLGDVGRRFNIFPAF